MWQKIADILYGDMAMSIGISLTAVIVDEDEQTSCTLNDGLRVVANAIGYC